MTLIRYQGATPVDVTIQRVRTMLYAPGVCADDRQVNLRYLIGTAGPVRLEIFDIAGRKLRSLDRAYRNSGEHRETWDRLDVSGRPVARGVYLVRLVARDAQISRKLTILR